MEWLFDNDKPIYLQLVEQLKIAIVTGVYKKGEKLPSVRDFATDTQVNPNTVQKALTELESQGIIYTQRTNGKFVTDDEQLLLLIKQQMAKQNLETFVTNMKKLGFDTNEIKNYVSSQIKGG